VFASVDGGRSVRRGLLFRGRRRHSGVAEGQLESPPGDSSHQRPVEHPQRLMRAAAGAEPIRTVVEYGFVNGLQYDCGRDSPCPLGFGLPPARLRAGGTTALGSCLGFWRRRVARGTGAGSSGVESGELRAVAYVSSLDGRRGCISEEQTAIFERPSFGIPRGSCRWSARRGTQAAWALCGVLSPAAERAHNDQAGRLWDVLWMLRVAAKRARAGRVRNRLRDSMCHDERYPKPCCSSRPRGTRRRWRARHHRHASRRVVSLPQCAENRKTAANAPPRHTPASTGAGPNMAGIMLTTGTTGSEGTLGGLVEEGRRIRHHLREAWALGRLCSNDPVTIRAPRRATATPRTPRVTGVSTSRNARASGFNRFLDRGLVVPTIGNDPDTKRPRTGDPP
jgi:hypothetical protein